jgi:hypothetical protein
MKHLLTYKLFENKILDKILDKISETGKDSLTKDELIYLDQYSKGEVDDRLENILSKETKTVKSEQKDIPSLSFTLKDIDITDDRITYYGDLIWNDNEYLGVVNYLPDGEFEDAEFYIKEPDEFHDEMSDNLYPDAEGYEENLNIFFKDELFSKLI